MYSGGRNQIHGKMLIGRGVKEKSPGDATLWTLVVAAEVVVLQSCTTCTGLGSQCD